MNRRVKTSHKPEIEGWEIASVTGGEHLKRTLQMYSELGIEVHLEEVKPDQCEGCAECYKADNEPLFRIYTRAKDKQSEKGLH